MRVIFAGTPEFAAMALRQLHAAGHDIALVLTQPDRPAGRGMKLQESAVKQFAVEHAVPVAQPRSLRLSGKYPEDAAAAQKAMLAAQADVMVVAAYGLILPQWVLDAPRLGCLNIHASLLPRWRGAAPIHRAIEAGDVETGITIMQMDAGLDTGDMLLVEKLPIVQTDMPASERPGDQEGEQPGKQAGAQTNVQGDTTTTLHDKLAALGGHCIVQALKLLATGNLKPVPQPRADNDVQAAALGISYAHKIDKAEARIDWSQSAVQIERKVRALDPFPGCTAQIQGELVKITRCEINSCLRISGGGFGTILQINSSGISVQCGTDALKLTELQRAGGKRLAAADFLHGFALKVGQHFE